MGWYGVLWGDVGWYGVVWGGMGCYEVIWGAMRCLGCYGVPSRLSSWYIGETQAGVTCDLQDEH